jgi:replicative DNA helicase
MQQDLPAERAVLSGIYKHGADTYLDIADILQQSTFTDTTNQALYKCMSCLYDDGVEQLDEASIFSKAKELGYEEIFTDPNERTYLRSIFNSSVKSQNIPRFASKIRKLEIARLLHNQIGDAQTSLTKITGNEAIEEIIGIAEESIFDFTSLLQDPNQQQLSQITDGLAEYLEYVKDNQRDIIGIPSGYSYYDTAIGGGFRRRTVSLIGARTKVGKSILALNISLYLTIIKKIPVLYLDTEMDKEDQWPRMIASLARGKNIKVTITEIETGKFANKYAKEIDDIANDIKDIPFYHENVSGKEFTEILSLMRRWVRKHVGFDENGNMKDCLIIYDYLKLTTSKDISHNLQEYQILGFIATAMHNFTVRHNLPILSFIQLNRDGIDRESSSAFSQSDRILWLVTNYSIFKFKSPEDIAESGGPLHGTHKLVTLAARHGPGMAEGDYLNIHVEKEHAWIREGDTRYNLKSGSSIPQTLEQPIDRVPLDE